MESEDDDDDAHGELDVTEQYLLQTLTRERSPRPTFLKHFQDLIPRQTIIYIQYCLLRIPFLLVYDYLFTDQFSALVDYFYQYSVQVVDRDNPGWFRPISYILCSSLFQFLIQINLRFSVPIIGLVLLTVLLLCLDQQLVMLYSYTISTLVIYFYYQINRLTSIQFSTFLLQVILSFVYMQMLTIRSSAHGSTSERCLCYAAPFVFLFTRFALPLRYGVALLNAYYSVWLFIHLCELIDQRKAIIHSIRITFLNELISVYENLGMQMVLNYLQTRIHIMTLLKIFWLTKVLVLPLGIRAIYTSPFVANIARYPNVTMNNDMLGLNASANRNAEYNATLTKTIYFTAMYYGTETVLTLISLACLVSYGMKAMSHRLFRRLQLWTEDVEQIGTVIGVMFFLLLFQSNLSRLDLNRRHIALLKAFSLLVVALFHFLHTILEPQLLKVAMQTMTTRMAFNDLSEHRVGDEGDTIEPTPTPTPLNVLGQLLRSYHHRHVYTCISIFFMLILYIVVLWRFTVFSTWLLAITAFSLELIVRLIASLAQYTLYVLDAHNRLSHVDSFDEYIFRIKAVTSCFEFILGVFLLLNGFYILCFEARGALRALMLAIHAHLNIVKNLRRGWQILRNRKSAWDNVNQLPLATEDQILLYNDICSICHGVLTIGSTCITPCSHLFHQKCLQKAFYATQNCALCSRPIVGEKNDHEHQQ